MKISHKKISVIATKDGGVLSVGYKNYELKKNKEFTLEI